MKSCDELFLSDTQLKLLANLADGHYHSGTVLADTLNLSRTAIWKQIHQLIELGVPIVRNKQQGYSLSMPMILLNQTSIMNHLQSAGFERSLDVHLLASLDSTNRFLKDLPMTQNIGLCCAEQQTQGRGRFGRTWYSPFGENIYCSTRWQVNCDLSHLSGLGLVVSMAALSAIEDQGIPDVNIKWPNDLLWSGKKLCGSLIEVIAESNGSAHLIIGVGLNVNSSTHDQNLFDKPWCSLHDITGCYFDRNALIASLIIRLEQYLHQMIVDGFGSFIKQWQRVDYLHGQSITISQGSQRLNGTAQGINDLGQLIIVDELGVTHYLSSGDTTLR